MRLKDPLTLAGFIVVGAAVVASPYPAAGIFALGVLVVLYIRRVLWMSAIGALALVPLWALFGSKGAEDY